MKPICQIEFLFRYVGRIVASSNLLAALGVLVVGGCASDGIRLYDDQGEESYIVSEFKGFNNGNVYELANGELWEQIEPYIWIYIWIQPHVVVWRHGLVGMMKVEGIDHAISVRKVEPISRSNLAGDFEGFDQGNIYELVNGEFWEQTETYLSVSIDMEPRVLVWSDGVVSKMKIGRADHAITVRRVEPVVHSVMVGDFKGFSFGNIYNLANGQSWEQAEALTRSRYLMRPTVVIWNSDGIFKMKVGENPDAVIVRKVK